MTKEWCIKKSLPKVRMVIANCNSCIQEAEAGEWQVWSQPRLHSKQVCIPNLLPWVERHLITQSLPRSYSPRLASGYKSTQWGRCTWGSSVYSKGGQALPKHQRSMTSQIVGHRRQLTCLSAGSVRALKKTPQGSEALRPLWARLTKSIEATVESLGDLSVKLWQKDAKFPDDWTHRPQHATLGCWDMLISRLAYSWFLPSKKKKTLLFSFF